VTLKFHVKYFKSNMAFCVNKTLFRHKDTFLRNNFVCFLSFVYIGHDCIYYNTLQDSPLLMNRVASYYVAASVLCVRRVTFGFRRGSVSFMGKLE